MNGKRPGGWVALAWRYYRDEKMLAVSADAELLYGHALAFAGEGETDGRVPVVALGLLASKLVGPVEVAAVELVTAGLWHQDGRNFIIHAWDRWQVTAEQARDGRARDAKRKAIARANADIHADSSGDSPGDSPRNLGWAGAGAGAGAVLSTATPDPLHAVQERDASQEPDLEPWLDERGYLFVGRPEANGQEP